jgi:hypothetical protein
VELQGPVAQLVEQGTFNPKVAGSSPARPTRTDASQPQSGTLREVGLDPRMTGVVVKMPRREVRGLGTGQGRPLGLAQGSSAVHLTDRRWKDEARS